MNRSEYKNMASMSPETVTFNGLIQGAGAAAPVVAPTTFSSTSSKGYASIANNYVSRVATDITRSGVGAYTVKFVDSIPVVFDIDANVWGPNGTTATISDYNPSTRTVTILTWSVVGAAADLAATEFLRFTIWGQLSVFP